MCPNKDVRDLSEGDCDTPNSDMCVCVCRIPHLAFIGSNWALLTITRNPNCNLTSPFEL
jgi:hypothetical protein